MDWDAAKSIAIGWLGVSGSNLVMIRQWKLLERRSDWSIFIVHLCVHVQNTWYSETDAVA